MSITSFKHAPRLHPGLMTDTGPELYTDAVDDPSLDRFADRLKARVHDALRVLE